MSIKESIKSMVPKRTWKFFKDAYNAKLWRKELRACTADVEYPEHEGPIRVVFIVYYPAVWPSMKSVYDRLVCDERFETLVVAVPRSHHNGDYDVVLDTTDTTVYEFCEHENLHFVKAYNAQTGEWFDLRAWQPDFAFYCRPYNFQLPDCYRSNLVCHYARVCDLPYGYNISAYMMQTPLKNFDYIASVSHYFASTESGLEYSRSVAPYLYSFFAERRYVSGYPGFDNVAQLTKSAASTQKTVSWFPRFIGGEGNFPSTFLDLKEGFLAFARKRRDLRFIVRPHPLLFSTLLEKGLQTQEELDAFRIQCEEASNIMLDDEGDFSYALGEADIILSDFSTLMATYLAARKKVVTLIDHLERLTTEGQLIVSTFYRVSSWDEAQSAIEALLEGRDEKAAKREEAAQTLKIDGMAGKRIAEYLVQVWDARDAAHSSAVVADDKGCDA